MKNRWFGIFLIVLGLSLIIGFMSFNFTGNVVGTKLTPGFSFLGFVLVLIGAGVLMSKEGGIEHLLGYVRGINPTDKNKVSESPLYAKITSKNIEEVFQTDLNHKYNKPTKGAKAIIYKDHSGNYHTAFLTEAINTHHRHAAATVARLAENIDFDDPSYLNKKLDALYEGNSKKTDELLTQCAGFELQYDPENQKIIGIQQDSWLTKEQERRNKKIDKSIQEDMILELLEKIDPGYLSEGLKNLEDDEIESLYAGKIAA